MKIEDLKLENLKKLYPGKNIIGLDRVYFKNYQYVSELDDLMNNSTLVGDYYEEVCQDPEERLWNLVHNYLKAMDNNYKDDDDDYDYFEDDFVSFIYDEETEEGTKLLELVGDETDFVRVAIVSLNYDMVYTLSDEKQIDILKAYPLLQTLYQQFVDKIDEEM